MEASAWQTKLSSFKERHLYAYNKSLFCDVEFSVMDANGDKVPIPAHKYILAISSPVFEAMFYGESAETGRTIDLPDCTKEGLQEMLLYVYSDEVNLTGSNVLQVLCLAERYMLPLLKEKCEAYLEKELKPEEVFHVLPHVRNEKVEQKCWDMVDSDAERAVSSESFLNVSKEMLGKVLGRDTMSIDKVVLLQAVEKWALNKLKEEGLEESMENKRALSTWGRSDQTYSISTDVTEKVAEKVEIFKDTTTELVQTFSGLCPLKRSVSNNRKGSYKAKVIIPNTRFAKIRKPGGGRWSYLNGKSDAISFKVNKPLSLAGVRLFGDEGSTYHVNLALYKSARPIKHISSPFSTEDEEKDGYYGFTIPHKPVPLDPDVLYTIEATISGPCSYSGFKGETTIAFEDIVITYHNCSYKKSENQTSTEWGQFPTLEFEIEGGNWKVRRQSLTEDGKPTVEVNGIVVTFMSSEKSQNGTSEKKGQFPTLIFRKKDDLQS
ncbi:BTB/POZ domain-containing protein 6-B-like [Actinia tenebrosa]|uniref:BTB/POZ domain-containing protein 6-B-like n=1 Tax=Actinia tenebrosa TaxID=6105 RepID=A0A6P8IIK2_ACTTE|nr:BTB/POZ domain-containing protein 6-B-like [Actinia tenebrosa]